MPYQTDERLKSYLDANQLHREQLCLAILATDKRFSDIRPRHPRGGPDGGRDIEAIFRHDHRAHVAVGFLNQAADSEDKRKQIRKKFHEDLQNSLSAAPKSGAFFFLTNVNLTAGEKELLVSNARTAGVLYCEIFDRERLRIVLDSPDGCSIRFQYLGISLTESEQASFFARWGDDIQSVIATGFQRVEGTLERLLFLQEAAGSLCPLVMNFQLDRVYSSDEIGHFRAFCPVYLKEPKCRIMSILFGATDISERMRSDLEGRTRAETPGIGHGVGTGQWEQRWESSAGVADESDEEKPEKYRQVGCSSSIGREAVEYIGIQYNKDSFIRFEPGLKLIDIDEAMFLPMLNRSLAEKLVQIHIYAGDYKLMELESSDIAIDPSEFDPRLPVMFAAAELQDPWVRVRPAGGSSAFRFRFSEHTPHRFYSSKKIEGSTKPVSGK